MEIHVISNGSLPLEDFASRLAVIEPYVDYFHIREKELAALEIAEGVDHLENQGIPLSKIIINDRVDVAMIKGTRGVQLAYHSLDVYDVKSALPQLLIGKSVHSIPEAIEAEREGADYLLYGHIYESKSKTNLPPKGTKQLKDIVQYVSIPVIAIGGIKPDHVQNIHKTGAKGIAIMSNIIEATDPLTMIKLYREMEEN